MYPANRRILLNDNEFLINLKQIDRFVFVPDSWGRAQKAILIDAEEYSDYLFLATNGKYWIRKYNSEEEHPRYHLKFAEYTLEIGEYLILHRNTKDIKDIKEYTIRNYPFKIDSEQGSDIIFLKEGTDLEIVFEYKRDIFYLFYYAVFNYSVVQDNILISIKIEDKIEYPF